MICGTYEPGQISASARRFFQDQSHRICWNRVVRAAANVVGDSEESRLECVTGQSTNDYGSIPLMASEVDHCHVLMPSSDCLSRSRSTPPQIVNEHHVLERCPYISWLEANVQVLYAPLLATGISQQHRSSLRRQGMCVSPTRASCR